MACSANCVGNCCTESCTAGCSDCTGGCNAGNSCQYWCGSGCVDGCVGTCNSTSTDTGSGGSSGCGECSGKCKDNCSSDCTEGCNNQCDGKAQDTNIADMGDILHKKFLKNDMSNIAKCINHEVKRRGETPDAVSFVKGERIDDEKINKLISNLEKTGQKLSNSAQEKKKGLYSLGQALIDKVIAAYKETVDYDALGITVPDDVYKSIIPLN